MCFMLFVGTDEPLPSREWRKEAPDICVQPVGEKESAVRVHFTRPVVQYVGSTSGCGCDFPHWLLYNGEEPNHVPEEIAFRADPEAPGALNTTASVWWNYWSAVRKA